MRTYSLDVFSGCLVQSFWQDRGVIDPILLLRDRWDEKEARPWRLFPGGGDPFTLHLSVGTLWDWSVVAKGQSSELGNRYLRATEKVSHLQITCGTEGGPVYVLQIKTSSNNDLKVQAVSFSKILMSEDCEPESLQRTQITIWFCLSLFCAELKFIPLWIKLDHAYKMHGATFCWKVLLPLW